MAGEINIKGKKAPKGEKMTEGNFPRRPWLRRLLALISSILFVIMLLHTANRYLTTPGLSIRDSEFVKNHFSERKVVLQGINYNDLTDGGIQATVTLSTNLFQVGLLVIAGLAGLLIARDEEARFVLGRTPPEVIPPELIMFIWAALLLLLSFVSHILYLKELSYLYFLAGGYYEPLKPKVADISNPNVSFLLTYQLEYLLCGTAVALFTFFSAHILKGRKES